MELYFTRGSDEYTLCVMIFEKILNSEFLQKYFCEFCKTFTKINRFMKIAGQNRNVRI